MPHKKSVLTFALSLVALASVSAADDLKFGVRTGFYEFSRRAGDFALAMTAVALRREGKRIAEARIGIGGVEDRPSRCAAAEALLMQGRSAQDAAQAVAQAVKPMADIHADAPYRKDLVSATTLRALEQALA